MRFAGNLFGVFQRFHPLGCFAGSGIGLATVRRIVARQGGRTGGEGVVDRGATFWFSLPDPTPGPACPDPA
jgi:signal transduction histidine kinase